MKIIPYGKHCIDEADIANVSNVLRSDWITQGPRVRDFELAIANYCHVKYAVAVSSGTAALHLACLVSGLKQGDEAITTPITFLATANSVLYAGAKPIFVDINNKTVNIDINGIEEKITKKTRVILPVHFAGLPCEMPEIYKIAKKNGLKIIEDACHALGAEYKYKGKWIKVGACEHSDMTIFSFHPVKQITTGEGGAITTNNYSLYKKLSALRTHGVYKNGSMTKNEGLWYYEMRALGFNYRITDFQSALGISQLKKIESFIKRRHEIAGQYNEAFRNNPYIDLPVENQTVKNAWHLYVIKLKGKYTLRKKVLFGKLRAAGVGVQVHYIPVYLQPYYKKYVTHRHNYCLVAEDYYKRALSLPIFPKMTYNQVKFVIKNIKKLIK